MRWCAIFKFPAMRVALLLASAVLWTPNASPGQITEMGPAGGPGGSPFVDCGATVVDGALVRPVEVHVRAGDFIDAIEVIYSGGARSTRHGGLGGDLHIFRLGPDEYITDVGGKYAQFVNSLFIKTNKGRVQQWGGSGGNAQFSFSAPRGMSFNGFWGRSGVYLDAIGVCLLNPN